MPTEARWYWNERVERYVTSRNGVGESWRRQVRRALRNVPGWFERLDFEPPGSASAVTRRMVEALRDTPLLAPCTRQNWTSKLRGFLASERSPLAADTELWHFGKPVPRKRPYLEGEDNLERGSRTRAHSGRSRPVKRVACMRNGPPSAPRFGDGRTSSNDVGAWEGDSRRQAATNPHQSHGLWRDCGGRPGSPFRGPRFPGSLRCHRQGMAGCATACGIRSRRNARPPPVLRSYQPRRRDPDSRDTGDVRACCRVHNRPVHRSRGAEDGERHGTDGRVLPGGSLDAYSDAIRVSLVRGPLRSSTRPSPAAPGRARTLRG